MMHRYDFLTGASLLHGSVADDFADLIGEPDDERIVEGLKTGYTRALFNAVVAVKQASEPELMLDLLLSINRNASRPDDWRIIEEGRIDLENTLLLIQMELTISSAICGYRAMPLISEALATDNDVLHFGVFQGVAASRDASFAELIERYIADFDNRNLHADSRSHLLAAANEALDACSPFQLL